MSNDLDQRDTPDQDAHRLDEVLRQLLDPSYVPPWCAGILPPCPLCQSLQLMVCADSNNLMKARVKCRECQCEAPMRSWMARKTSEPSGSPKSGVRTPV